MQSANINETVNTIVTGGLVLEASTPAFRKMTMLQVVEAIITGRVDNESLALATTALGKNATEFALELDAVLRTQQHGGNFSETMYITGIVMAIITSCVVVMRLCSRRMLGLAFRVEDYLIVFALLLALVFASLMQHSTIYGGGTHIWDTTFNNVFWVTRCLYICEYLYTGGIIAVKASLLIFFYRLTPQRWYRMTVIGVATFVALMSVGMLFAMAFQCKPVVWYKNVIGRKCFDEFAFWTAFGSLCIFSDILILLLPIPVVWNLQLRTKDKIGVTALFSLGGIVCIAAGLRLKTLQAFVRSVDFTSGEGAFGLWCIIELDTAIICASIPACKGLFARIAAPRISGYFSKDKNSKMVNTFNSAANDKAVVSNPHLRGQEVNMSNLSKSGKGILRTDTFTVDYEDEVPLGPTRDRSGSAASGASQGGLTISVENVNAQNTAGENIPRLPKSLQVPGVYYASGPRPSATRESASTLGDDLEAQTTRTQEDVRFAGLSPSSRNSNH